MKEAYGPEVVGLRPKISVCASPRREDVIHFKETIQRVFIDADQINGLQKKESALALDVRVTPIIARSGEGRRRLLAISATAS